MRNIFFLTVFLFLTVVRANDKKICIFLGAKKLEDHQQDNYRLASFYCKDGQDESFDESNWPLRKKDYPLNKEKDNVFSIKYLKMNKVVKTIKFKFTESPFIIGCPQYDPNSSESRPTKEELERERREKEMSVYNYEQRFLIKDEAFAEEIQIFKSKKLVTSSKINFDYYKGK